MLLDIIVKNISTYLLFNKRTFNNQCFYQIWISYESRKVKQTWDIAIRSLSGK